MTSHKKGKGDCFLRALVQGVRKMSVSVTSFKNAPKWKSTSYRPSSSHCLFQYFLVLGDGFPPKKAPYGVSGVFIPCKKNGKWSSSSRFRFWKWKKNIEGAPGSSGLHRSLAPKMYGVQIPKGEIEQGWSWGRFLDSKSRAIRRSFSHEFEAKKFNVDDAFG